MIEERAADNQKKKRSNDKFRISGMDNLFFSFLLINWPLLYYFSIINEIFSNFKKNIKYIDENFYSQNKISKVCMMFVCMREWVCLCVCGVVTFFNMTNIQLLRYNYYYYCKRLLALFTTIFIYFDY